MNDGWIEQNIVQCYTTYLDKLLDTPSSTTMDDRIRPSRMFILGHRGASAHLPENTLASYEAAIAEGADGIESGGSRVEDVREEQYGGLIQRGLNG
jgi:hypothetical protein